MPQCTNPIRLSLATYLFLGLAVHLASSEPVDSAPKRIKLAPNLFFEKEGDKRRVIVEATVCFREGQLEGLLCRKQTKEHEYILTADVDGRSIHAALVAAGAKPGNPVTFIPKYLPATGTTIKVSLRYTKEGKTVQIAAQEWIVAAKPQRKPLAQDWVFGGSRFVPFPDDNTKPPYYLANQGDLICVCNMESAMLDLPVQSPKKFDDRLFSANTGRIPPLDTKVEVILEPVPEIIKK